MFFSRFQFQKNLRRIISQLYIRDNCHPFKASLLVWVQLPLWISLSLALRNLSLDKPGKFTLTLAQADCGLILVQGKQQPVSSAGLKSELATGGALWFSDLTLPDSTWILPICLGLTNLLIVEVSLFSRHVVT